MAGPVPGLPGRTWSCGWRSSAPGQHLLRGLPRSTWKLSPSAEARPWRAQVDLAAACLQHEPLKHHLLVLPEGHPSVCVHLLGALTLTITTALHPHSCSNMCFCLILDLGLSDCPGLSGSSRWILQAGKAAKFLGKLGRRVARTPKYGGGGSLDAAPTPLIHEAYGGPPGCVQLGAKAVFSLQQRQWAPSE